MHLTLALLAGLGAFVLLVVLITWLQRKSFLVRQLAFPLYVAALALTVEVFGLFEPPGWSIDGARAWILLFLGAVTLLRLLGLYWIRVGDQEGRVVAITWRTTQSAHAGQRQPGDPQRQAGGRTGDELLLPAPHAHGAHQGGRVLPGAALPRAAGAGRGRLGAGRDPGQAHARGLRPLVRRAR